MTSTQTLLNIDSYNFNYNFVFGNNTVDRIDNKLYKHKFREIEDRNQNRADFLEFLHLEFKVYFQKKSTLDQQDYTQIMIRSGYNEILSLIKGDLRKLTKLTSYYNKVLSNNDQKYDITSVIKEVLDLSIKRASTTNIAQNLIDTLVFILEISFYLKELDSRPINEPQIRINLKSISHKTKIGDFQLKLILMLVDKICETSKKSELKRILLIFFIQNIRNTQHNFENTLGTYADYLAECGKQKNAILEILTMYRQCMGFNSITYSQSFSLSILKITQEHLTTALAQNDDKTFQDLINSGYSKIGIFLFYTELCNICQSKSIDRNKLNQAQTNLNAFLKLIVPRQTENLSITYKTILIRFHKIARECIVNNAGKTEEAKEEFLLKLRLFFKNITMFGGAIFDLLKELERVNDDIQTLQNTTEIEFDERDRRYEMCVGSYNYTSGLINVFMKFIYDNNFR